VKKGVAGRENCAVGDHGSTNETHQGGTPTLEKVLGTLRTLLWGDFWGFFGGVHFFSVGLFSSLGGRFPSANLVLPLHGAFF
jgi:hypothetical protein